MWNGTYWLVGNITGKYFQVISLEGNTPYNDVRNEGEKKKNKKRK